MTAYDHYKEAKHLASLLDKDGAQEHADLLLNAMIEGCTGTEIFMALSYHVKNVLKLESISTETRECAKRLRRELNKAYHACD